jgi:hypothetical protein
MSASAPFLSSPKCGEVSTSKMGRNTDGSYQKMPLIAVEKWKWSFWQPLSARLATMRSNGVGAFNEPMTSLEMIIELLK